eukprot:gene3852-4801_t
MEKTIYYENLSCVFRAVAYIIKIEHDVSGERTKLPISYDIITIYAVIFFLCEWTGIDKMDMLQHIVIVILIIWATVMNIIQSTTDKDIWTAYVIIFLFMIAILLLFFGIYGTLLHKALLRERVEKKSGSSVSDSIEAAAAKTIILLSVLVVLVVLTIIKLIIFELILTRDLKNKAIQDFITMVLELSQIYVVMIVLSGGNIKRFLIFKKASMSFDRNSTNAIEFSTNKKFSSTNTAGGSGGNPNINNNFMNSSISTSNNHLNNSSYNSNSIDDFKKKENINNNNNNSNSGEISFDSNSVDITVEA